MRSWVDEGAFPSNTNCSERVVTSNHTADEVGGSQSLNSRSRSWLQLVFEYDEAEETQSGLGLFTAKEYERDENLDVVVCTNRFIFCALSQDSPSILLPAMAMTRYPRLV